MQLFFKNAAAYMDGLTEIQKDLHFTITDSPKTADCSVEIIEQTAESLIVQLQDKHAVIQYGQGTVKLYRGLMLLCHALHGGKTVFSAEETPYFKSNGPFLDLARNMALTVSSLKYILRKCAAMGLNTLTLYLEDMYELPGQPYFGYMRGRYSKADFQELCRYAGQFGIELVPYVEFFGHMDKFLHYQSAAPVRGNRNTFLFGSQATYDFIEIMVRTLRECFTGNRICVGGDEVFEGNKGAYETLHGQRDLEDVFFEHANAVYDIVVKYGFQPFLSNDMYFYFRNNQIMPPSYFPCVDTVEFEDGIKDKVPEAMGKIFWDYIDEDEEKMVRMMALSKKQGGPIMWLGSVRMWQSLCLQYTPTITNILTGIRACKRTGIDTMAFCTFEDTGAVSHFLALPAFLACAQMDYTGVYDESVMGTLIKFLFGADYEDFLRMEQADFIHQNGHTEFASLYLLFNDPLIGLLDKEIEGMDLKSYYRRLLEDYSDRGTGDAPIQLSFDHYKCMVSILELKADYGLRLKAAYDARNREALSRLADEALEIKQRYERLMEINRDLFTDYYKGFGSEKFDMRYGTMAARFDTVRYRIQKYLRGDISSIDELEEEKLRYDHFRFEDTTGVNIYFSTSFQNMISEAL